MSHEREPRDRRREATREFAEGEEAPPRFVGAMAALRWLLVGLMALVAAASLWRACGDRGSPKAGEAALYYCPMHPSVVQDQPGECPICGMSLVPKESHAHSAPGRAAPPRSADVESDPGPPATYACPMHPEQTSSDPNARCSLCGMRLTPSPRAPAPRTAPEVDAAGQIVSPHAAGERQASPPVFERERSSSAGPSHPAELVEIELAPERMQLLGMRTARASQAALPAALRTVGYVVPTEAGVQSVQIRFSGWVQELHARETGQPVKRGQLLARVYSPELLAAQQELLNAKRWAHDPARGPERGANTAGSLLAAAQSRLALLGVDPAQIAEIERSGTPDRLIEIRSPGRGYLVQKNALEGMYVQPGTQLFQIADLSRVWVIAEIFERDAALVRVGQGAALELAAYRGQRFFGRVQFLYPALDPDTRTLRARIEFKNPELQLRPGMFGDVQLELPVSSGLTIPREAVADTGEHQYVFVAKPGGRFEPRGVELGARDQERVQVLSGLVEGEQVVTTGNFLLDSESRLRSALEGTASAAARNAAPAGCDAQFDRARYPQKHAACRACEAQHRGSGALAEDCKRAIEKPWK